jgi:hypothetical protein
VAKTTRRGREVPRPFEFHWGGGQIVEEASYVGEHTEPAIQLLEYEGQERISTLSARPVVSDGSRAKPAILEAGIASDALSGSYGIRFCYYNHAGRFQRSPMMIDGDETFEGLRAALKETPKLRAMLKKLVA